MNILSKYCSVLSCIFLLTSCANNNKIENKNETASGLFTDCSETISNKIFFNVDSSALNSESQSTLERQATWLNQHADINVVVEGHCDERGTREYNLALGERRANAVKSVLVAAGVNASRITVISYGKERPAVLGADEDAWKQNRRAVTVLAL